MANTERIGLPEAMGEVLVMHLETQGWSQRQLAAEINVPQTTFNRWARGTYTLSLADLDRVAHALEVSPALLMLQACRIMDGIEGSPRRAHPGEDITTVGLSQGYDFGSVPRARARSRASRPSA